MKRKLYFLSHDDDEDVVTCREYIYSCWLLRFVGFKLSKRTVNFERIGPMWINIESDREVSTTCAVFLNEAVRREEERESWKMRSRS